MIYNNIRLAYKLPIQIKNSFIHLKNVLVKPKFYSNANKYMFYNISIFIFVQD
jgi:hypothetical protein